jgi:hypothetical protein
VDSGVSAVRAFISHASEDKEDFVEPLARELAEMGVAPGVGEHLLQALAIGVRAGLLVDEDPLARDAAGGQRVELPVE